MVMADTEGPAAALSCLSALASIRDTAARGKASAVAAIAADLLTALPASAQPGSVLGEGIAALQRAIEQAAAPAPAAVHLSPAHDPELMNDFILESGEHLANIEGQVLTLERDPCDSEALNAAFRGLHTIKGLAGFLVVWEVQKLAHGVDAAREHSPHGLPRLQSA